jgi:HSP20 family protein
MQHELERLVGRGAAAARQIGGGVYPAVNVFNGLDDILVQCEVAGVARENLELSITGETLAIKGTKKAPPDAENRRYQRQERGFGEFSRTVVLPDKVDADRVEARLEAGILTIRLPKSEAAKPRQIPVG